MRTIALIALGALVLGCNKEQKVDVGNDAAVVVPSASALASAIPAATAAAAGATPPDACRLASQAELGTIVGAKLGAGTPTPGATSVSACIYDDQGGGTVSLTLRTEIIGRSGYESTVKTMQGGEKVTGLGDDAYFHHASMGPVGVGTLLVYKGKTLLSITYGDMKLTKDKALAVEKKLAEKLLTKI